MNDKLKLTEDTKGFVKSNLESIYSTRSWEEMDQTRNQALQDYMAGVTDQITPATQPATPIIDHSNLKGNPYDTQQEVLSRLNLLDDSLNPTSTYTDYIKNGGTPVPGYESDHNTLLFLDQVSQKTEQLNSGQITEDQLLWDLYSSDILETQGYKIKSVGWWQSKFSNNDFTNPLTNRYLQNQVLQTAREYHNSLMAQQYIHNKQTKDSHLSTLLNKGDLDNKDIATLFPELAKAIKETQQDTDYLSYITSGRVSAQQRIYQSETGDYYYLHTDGELYKLSNEEKGPKVASFKQDKDGSFTEISLNGSDIVDMANSFKAGAASTLTGFVKIGGFLYGATMGLLEGDISEGIADSLSHLDSVFNNDLAWLTDSGYVDLNGFQLNEWKDWGILLSTTAGAMAAGATLGGAAGKVVQWGNTLTPTHPILGRTLSWGAQLYQRSTGLYKGAGTGYYRGPITKHIISSWLPTINNLKTVSVYMMKDYMNTTSSLYNQRIQKQLADYTQDPTTYNKDSYATDKEIQAEAFKVATLNGLISSVLAGGMDDNQTQRWAALLSPRKDTTVPLNSLARTLLKYQVSFNTTADFLDNFLTNWTTSQVKLDKDGKIDGFDIFNQDDWNILSAEGAQTLVRAAIQTLPTLQKQLQRRNIAAEQATTLHKNYLDKLVSEEQNTTDAHKKEVLQTIRLNYLEDMQKGAPNKDDQSQADKILYALSKQHEYLRNSNDKSIVSDILKDTLDPVMLGIYTETNKLMEESYKTYLQHTDSLDSHIEERGIRAFLTRRITEHFRNNYTQYKAAKNYEEAQSYVDAFTNKTISTYLTVTDSKDSTEQHEKLAATLNITAEQLSKSKETFLTTRQLKNRDNKITDAMLLEAAQRKADDINGPAENGVTAQEILGSSKFFRVKNESDDRPTFNAERAALFVASQVMPDNMYKINDYTYGMLALDNEISKLFTSDMVSKLSVGMNALGSDNPTVKMAGIDLMLTSMWGDTATKLFRNGQQDKTVTKETVEMLLNTAIDNNVITKKDAAEFLISLSDSDNETGRALDSVFKSKVSVTNLDKLDTLSELEKYTLLYESVRQLNNPDAQRFSGKTIAAQAMMQQGYDKILFEVLHDVGDQLPDYMKQYQLRAEAAKEKELFPLATDSVIQGLTRVIGDDNIKTESDLKKYLHSLAKDATTEEVNAQANVLFQMLKDLRKYKSIDYKGDTVSIDISEWSNKSYRKMLKAIDSTSPEYLDSMLERDSLPSVTEHEANQVLSMRSTDKKPLITITLDDSNMDQIKELYNMLKEGNLIPSWTTEPKTAADMKRILAQQAEDSKFLRYKNGKEYDTGIISEKDKKLIKAKLEQYEPKDIIKAATAFDTTLTKELRAMRYDYYTMLGANIDIKKLSQAANAASFRIEGSPFYINPVNPETLEVEHNGAPMFLTKETNNKNKSGRVASTVSSILALDNISSYDMAKVNKDLALTLMVDQYIDFVLENKNKLNIMVPEKFAEKLHNLEIAGTENSFYDVDEVPIELEGKSYVSLTLNDNATKEAMELYLLSSKEPNLFKILPFVSDSEAKFTDVKFLSTEGEKIGFIPDIRAGNLSDPNGLYKALNIMFDYDQTGKLRQDLLTGMFEQAKNGKFNYNPFSELKQMFDIEALCKKMNNNDAIAAYTKYREGYLQSDLDDPFYTLAVAYKDINNKYEDDDNNDDYKLWLLHGNVLKRMVQAAQAGDESIDVNEIKQLYSDSTNHNFKTGYYTEDPVSIKYSDITPNSFFGSPINITNDTVMSKQLLDRANGVDYQLVDASGNYTVPKLGDQSIIDAYNYVKNNINDFDQTQDIIMSAWNTNSKNYRYYEPSDATHLWTILSAAEGSITIEDLDALTRIEADAYNEFFEQLGMKKGYGLEVKRKVDTLYEQLSKYFMNPNESRVSVNKQLTFKEPRTGSASTSEQYNRMPININSKEAKQALNRRALDYITSYEDRPQITPERLIDGLSTSYDDFNASYNNYKRSNLENYKSKLYNQKGEIAVNDNGDYLGNQFIDDISSEINIEKLARAAENTHNSMAEQMKINIQDKDIEENLVNTATTYVERLTGAKMLGEYPRWSFLDTKTGKEYDNAVMTNNVDNHSNVDLVRTLWDEQKTNKDWIGKAFIDFEKKDTSGEGLTYSYKILENENDVINLKNQALLDLIKTNEWRLNGDINTFFDKMSTQEGANFINKIITNGITNRDKLTLLDNIFKDTNIQNTWQYKILAPTYLTDINKNTIRDIEGQLSSALNSTNMMTRRIGNAILFGIDYDGMDDEHKISADFIKTLLSQQDTDYINKNKTELDDMEYKINSGEQLTDYNLKKYRELYDINEDRESITNALYKYVMRNFNSPEVLDYFFNSKRTLNERYDSYTNGYDDSYKLKDIANNISSVSIKDIRDFFDADNLSYSGNLKKIIAFDTEGSNILKASGQTADSIKDLFQIAFITYTRDENGKLVAKKETYFIDHGGNDSDRFSKWVEAQIDDKDTNFYAKHKDYQEATKAYANLTGIEDNIITEDQVADILNGRLTSTPDLLVAYNGDNYEFRVLKGLLNSDIKTLDALEVVSKTEGDASKQLSQDSVYKRTFGDDQGDERHTADQDVSDMMELLNEYFNADNDLAYDRSLLVRNLLTLIPEEYQDAESIKHIFDIVENKLHDGGDLQETFNKVLGTFKQYEPTLDNIKAMQRAYNNLYNEAKGNVFFKIREALGYNPDNGYDLIVGSSKARNNIKNILAAKMVETNGDPIKAYNALYYDYINNSEGTDKSSNVFFKKLGNLDEDVLNKIHIDPEVFNTEDVINNKKALSFFEEGEAGYLKGKVNGVSSEIAKDFDANKKFLSYVYSTEDTLIKNKDLISEDTFNVFKDWFANRAISISESYDINKLPEYINTAIEYKTAGVDSLLAEIKNIINNNRGTGTFHGMYSMMDAINPGDNDDIFEVVNIGSKGEKLVPLKGVEAGDMIVTKGYLEQILNVHNISELRSDDPDDTNLYLLSVTNPADNMNSILPLRVRVIDGDDLTVRFTPETQAILRNRDFDGDHTITTVLAPGMKPVAKLIHDYMFNTYNVYEDITSYLKTLDNKLEADDFIDSHIYKIGSNENVLKACKELDSYLESIKDVVDISGEKYQKKIEALNNKILKAFETSTEYKDIIAQQWLMPNEIKDFNKKLLKQLGMEETFTNTDQVLRYVNNPALYSDTDTYTSKSRRAMFARQTLTGSNILDPKTGWAQKGWASGAMPTKDINNPLLDLYTPGIYLTGGTERMIDNSINTKESFDAYIDTLQHSLSKQVTEDKFDTSKEFIDDISSYLLKTKLATTDNFADKAKQVTMQMLWDLDIYTKSDTNVNKQFLDKLKLVADDDSFKQQLNVTKLLDNKLTELSKSGYSLYNNSAKDTPLADMLQQEAVQNKLSTTENGVLRIKDSISDKYNLVNVFVTKGVTNSEDSILYTDYIKNGATAIAVLPKGNGIEYKKLPTDTLIRKDTIIGYKGNKPIKAQYDFYVNPQNKFKDELIINIPDNIQGKKLSGQGLFKGVAGKQVNLKDDANNISFVVDVRNATKNANKYSMGFDYRTAWKNAEPYTYTIDGKEYEGYILKNVPFNIIGDDDLYTQKINPNDPNTVKRFEVMSVPGSTGLIGIGMYGSTGLKVDEDGNLKLDTSDITNMLQQNRPKHNVVWGDAGTIVMQLRTEMLAKALGEQAFLGLVNQYSPEEFTSLDEYLTNLKNSREKINSQAVANEQNAMIRSLGKKKFISLYNTSDLTRYIFGREIQRLISPEEPSTFIDEFYTEPKSPSSKNSGKDQLRGSAKVIPGNYETPEGRNIENRGLIQNTLLHVPFDQFYHGITGNYLNQNEMIKAVIDGRLGYSRFLDDSAMIENDFTPVDTSMGTREYNFANKNIANAGEKTIVEGLSDYFRPYDYNYGTFKKGSNSGNVFEGAEDPYKPTFNSLVSKAVEEGHILSGYNPWQKFAYYMSIGEDKTKNTLSKIGTIKGYDSVDMHKYTPQFVNKKYGDKSVLNFMRVGEDKNVDLNEIQKEVNKYTKGYMLRKDIDDNINKPEFSAKDISDFKKSKTFETYNNLGEEAREVRKEKAIAYKNLIAALNSQSSNIVNNNIKFTWDVENSTTPWTDSVITRSGIKVDDENKLAVDIGIKNRYAESQYIQEDYLKDLTKLKTLVSKTNSAEFEDFAKYKWLEASKQSDPEGYETRAKYMNTTKPLMELETNYKNYVAKHPEVVQVYETYVNRVIDLAKKTSELRNEPFDSSYIFFAPYLSKDKDVRYNTVISNIRTMMSVNKYDPMAKRNALQQNMMFNFFEGSERIIKDLSEAYAVENISKALLGEYTDKALIDNKEIIDAAYNIIDDYDAFNDLKVYNKFDSDVTKEVLNVLSLYTDVDTYKLRKSAHDGGELLSHAYNKLHYNLEDLKEEFMDLTGLYPSLSQVYKTAESPDYNESTRVLAKKLSDNMWAEIIIGQRIIECSPQAQKKFNSFLMNTAKEGYVLVNKYGQRIERNRFLNPTTSTDLAYLKDNVEIAANSRNETMWNQFLLEKALSGEIYLAKADMVDQLEKHAYTTKIPSRIVSNLKKISSQSAGFQMALPAKMLGRLLRFTGFDYAMGAIGNYETIPNMSRAAKELSAALQSDGKNMTEDLKDYLRREGQPSYGRGVTTKDPINFTEDMGSNLLSKITNKLSSPLEFQNHLGRYAIYLTAKESFDNGTPWYGPLYYNHEAIDNIKDSRDKAMYIMDYMLGSPGGFPELSKKTSGLMMYSTFPMNLTRTMGAYGMSMAKLFQEGVTENNISQWYNTVIMPSLGTIGISMLGNLIISAICDRYGVDEETEKKWKEEGVTLDPLGTLIGGTPSVVYDSINPVYNLKEMFINPFTNEYNNTLPKKAYGWIKANMLSKLNPAIKTPIEIITGKDLYGDNAEGYQSSDSLFNKTKKNQYTTLENGMRKVLGYFVGSGVANSIVDERKVAKLETDDDTPSLNSYLWKGITKGISSDLGNQKSWKKNTSNYYAFLTDMKTWKKANAAKSQEGTGNASNTNGYYYLDIEDMTDAEKLYYNRTYGSMYGTFDEDDYTRVSSTLKKYINEHRDASTIYAYIVKEYNDNKVSEATMRAALNNNSILRKINQLKTGNQYINYLSSLTANEKARLQDAIEYEQEYYPILQYLFPDNVSKKKTYLPSYKKDYLGSGSGTPSSSRPYTPNNRYYPGRYYPSTYKFNKKTGRYGVNLERVKVNVSPQMAIWNQDKNLTQYQTGLDKTNDPRWLRSRDYTSRVYNI